MRFTLSLLTIALLSACGGESSSSKATTLSDQAKTSDSSPLAQRTHLKLNNFKVDNLDQLKFKSIDSDSISSVKNFE